MGKVLSVATRKARRFNAENRAHRHLDKEKLEAAPKFESNIRDYEQVLKGEPINFPLNQSTNANELFVSRQKRRTLPNWKVKRIPYWTNV